MSLSKQEDISRESLFTTVLEHSIYVFNKTDAKLRLVLHTADPDFNYAHVQLGKWPVDSQITKYLVALNAQEVGWLAENLPSLLTSIKKREVAFPVGDEFVNGARTLSVVEGVHPKTKKPLIKFAQAIRQEEGQEDKTRSVDFTVFTVEKIVKLLAPLDELLTLHDRESDPKAADLLMIMSEMFVGSLVESYTNFGGEPLSKRVRIQHNDISGKTVKAFMFYEPEIREAALRVLRVFGFKHEQIDQLFTGATLKALLTKVTSEHFAGLRVYHTNKMRALSFVIRTIGLELETLCQAIRPPLGFDDN